MSYLVKIAPSAHQEIASLPGFVRAEVRRLLRELERDPRPVRAKELRGKPSIYRIWVATKWRLVYKIDDDLVLVSVLRVRGKEDIDYESL